MSTYSLTLREIKGSALTYAELDGNFLYLQSQIGSAGSSGGSGSSGSSGSSGTSGIGINGSSGTSGQDGSSGTSGQNGSSGTSGEAGSSGTSGQDGSSGSSGINGTNGSSGTSGLALSDTLNYRTSSNPIGQGFITHNPLSNFNQLSYAFNTIHQQLHITGFILEQTITIDAIGMFGGGGSNFTASVAAAIYDARTASITFASAQALTASNLSNLTYYPNNLITTATFSANPPTNTEWLGAGLFFKPLATPVQLQANTPYFIGSYGSASFGLSPTAWTQMALVPRPNLGFASPTVQNGSATHFPNMLSGFFVGATFSQVYPFTLATSSFPSVMPDNIGLTPVNATTTQMRYLPMRILSIP